jgi:DNA-binding response OmpR family regulator
MNLSPKQRKFLESLELCEGTLVTRDMLNVILATPVGASGESRALDVIASYVRKYLATTGDSRYIEVVRNTGFVLLAHNQKTTAA